MIKKLEIQNFRSHRNTKLEFVKGVNCIIGLPDSGKTNIIRAINWALTNRPLGFRFHSNFAKEPTSVEIDFDNDHNICLVKSKAEANYACDEKVYKAIGSNVPDEVLKFANLTELNLQTQMDKPFLICESAGEVAKIFNRISKLEKPDVVIACMTTDINSRNKQAKSLLAEQVGIERKLKEFENLPAMKKSYEKIKVIADEILSIESNIENLSSLIDDIEEASATIEKMIDIKKAKKDLDAIEKSAADLLKIKDKVRSLNTFIANLTDIIDKMDNIKMDHKEMIEDYKNFLKTIKVCPYCEKCKEPISSHNLDKFTGELK